MNQTRLFCLAALASLATLATAPAAIAQDRPLATAVFAGGCFWCMEKPFDDLPGVVSTTSGYTGGIVADPTYEMVTSGATGHYEAVQVTYDPARISYANLLATYWRQVDPFDAGGQFCDRGESYRAAIFVGTRLERIAAEASVASVQRSLRRTVETRVIDRTAFYPAEAYHQDYYRQNPVRYRFYRTACGRDDRLRQIWGPPPR